MEITLPTHSVGTTEWTDSAYHKFETMDGDLLLRNGTFVTLSKEQKLTLLLAKNVLTTEKVANFDSGTALCYLLPSERKFIKKQFSGDSELLGSYNLSIAEEEALSATIVAYKELDTRIKAFKAEHPRANISY